MIRTTRTTLFLIFFMILANNRAAAQDSCKLPQVTIPEFNAAIAARDSGDLDSAIMLMEQTIKKFQGSPAPYYILGNWYWESDRQNDAREMWRKARRATAS